MQLAHIPQHAHSAAWIDERRAARQHLGLPIVISGINSRRLSPHMVDISSVGCRIERDLGFVIGSYATVEVKDFTSFGGWVVWQRPGELGIEFAHALPEPIVSHLAAFVR